VGLGGLIHGLARQRRVVDRETVEQVGEWLATAERPHDGVGRRHRAMQRADRIVRLGERPWRPQPIPGFVDLFPVVKRGFGGLRRPPHLAKPAVAGKMQNVGVRLEVVPLAQSLGGPGAGRQVVGAERHVGSPEIRC